MFIEWNRLGKLFIGSDKKWNGLLVVSQPNCNHNYKRGRPVLPFVGERGGLIF